MCVSSLCIRAFSLEMELRGFRRRRCNAAANSEESIAEWRRLAASSEHRQPIWVERLGIAVETHCRSSVPKMKDWGRKITENKSFIIEHPSLSSPSNRNEQTKQHNKVQHSKKYFFLFGQLRQHARRLFCSSFCDSLCSGEKRICNFVSETDI